MVRLIPPDTVIFIDEHIDSVPERAYPGTRKYHFRGGSGGEITRCRILLEDGHGVTQYREVPVDEIKTISNWCAACLEAMEVEK